MKRWKKIDTKESNGIDFKREFIMTFSNGKSIFSSKKIERFIVFWVFLILTVVYISINFSRLEAWDMVEITMLWLGYSGYNSLMSLRDRKLDNGTDEGTIG